MVSEIEAAAYRRGFADGVRAAAKAIKGLRHASDPAEQIAVNGDEAETGSMPPPPVRQLRENSDQMRVLKAIRARPGMRGVEILGWLAENGSTVHERTLRTALARLKVNFIEQREERWYEKQAAGQSN